jgi:hypothetical protein
MAKTAQLPWLARPLSQIDDNHATRATQHLCGHMIDMVLAGQFWMRLS